MKKLFIFPLALVLGLTILSISKATAQEEKSKLSFGLSLNTDAFFGVNPMLTGAYAFNDKTAFTFYGIQWGAGTAQAWGNWTEFGAGLNFTAGTFSINPQLGFTMGNLLSSGVAGRPVAGDGIVPNLTINHSSDKYEGQLYVGYYGALRDEKPNKNNYLHYWLNAGVKASSWLSLGAHYETLDFTGGTSATGASVEGSTVYTWLGPYVQFSKGNAGLRFAGGANLEDGTTGPDFYKMSFFFNF
ncbi:hypothetical protein FYC62_08225 [Pedobacter aquae]|uniref:Uncharacterized protein n=1 Tax=Pedobacter aquae TaxID=2605747 RepID=A0A5C0VHT5_9SPHI|nr:DUF6733 family protein [Pedobacter aquae]QEK51647.1 hypothetical protein FYC62_08225 [Pedobacter aquae]